LEYRADLVIDPSFPNDKGGFVVAQGFDPIALHNNMALGQLSGTFLKTASPTDPTTSYNPTALDDSGINGLKEFMTFTIVFSPKGTIVPTVSGRRIYFGTSNSTSPSNPPPASYFDSDPTKRLWALATGAGDIYTPATVQGKTGVGALTVFDLTKVEIMSPDARAAYLIENAPFLPVNCYTGQLFQRQ